MITVKLGELEGIIKGFGAIQFQKIPVKLAYRISKLIRIIHAEFKSYDELRIKLCTDYCKKDENDKPIIKDNKYVGLESNLAFLGKLAELQQVEVEVEFEPIPLELLEAEGVSITVSEVLILEKFISE